MSPELRQLLSLQGIDSEIRRLREEISTLPARRQQIEQQFAESVKEFLALKEELERVNAERRRLEIELAEEQHKHDKFKNDLMKARNSKEYETALREIDISKKAISSFETEILKLMEQADQLTAQINGRAPEIESRRAEVDRQLEEYRASAISSQQRLEVALLEREQLLASLSQQARVTYERVAQLRDGQALAEARDYSCLACRMKIRPQVFSDVRRGETIITCESCGRILYFNPEPALT